MDISCIVTLHSEGYLAHPTVKSLLAAIKYAQSTLKIDIEIIVVADNPSSLTQRYISQEMQHCAKIFIVNMSDPGLSRNHGIEAARGNHIAIIDGDDLISENWIANAYKLSLESERFIIHPEYNIFFGQHLRYLRHTDQEELSFNPTRLLLENFWSALSFSRRETYEKIPYEYAHIKDGFGYEDWHWNCEAIAAGFLHKVALGTHHFIRLKQIGSRNEAASKNGVLLRHSNLFDNGNFFNIEKE